MSNPDGMPIWYELMTPDPVAAGAFYTAVVGWSVAAFPMAGGADYPIVSAPDSAGIGGIVAPPHGVPAAGWQAYFAAADVDGMAARVPGLGGTVLMEPQDIPGVGRFAMIADPQGMVSYIMRGDNPAGSSAFDPAGTGHCGWNELITSDHLGALAFYGALFGWTSTSSMPVGPDEHYCFIDHGGQPLGATMTAGSMPTRWSYYFRVPSIAAAVEAATRLGGAIIQEKTALPTGEFIMLGADPQGLGFALVGGA